MKERIVTVLKSMCMLLLIAEGFLLNYAYLWILADLPDKWWAAILLGLMSEGSAIGLILWIAKEKKTE